MEIKKKPKNIVDIRFNFLDDTVFPKSIIEKIRDL